MGEEDPTGVSGLFNDGGGTADMRLAPSQNFLKPWRSGPLDPPNMIGSSSAFYLFLVISGFPGWDRI